MPQHKRQNAKQIYWEQHPQNLKTASRPRNLGEDDSVGRKSMSYHNSEFVTTTSGADGQRRKIFFTTLDFPSVSIL